MDSQPKNSHTTDDIIKTINKISEKLSDAIPSSYLPEDVVVELETLCSGINTLINQ